MMDAIKAYVRCRERSHERGEITLYGLTRAVICMQELGLDGRAAATDRRALAQPEAIPTRIDARYGIPIGIGCFVRKFIEGINRE